MAAKLPPPWDISADEKGHQNTKSLSTKLAAVRGRPATRVTSWPLSDTTAPVLVAVMVKAAAE